MVLASRSSSVASRVRVGASMPADRPLAGRLSRSVSAKAEAGQASPASANTPAARLIRNMLFLLNQGCVAQPLVVPDGVFRWHAIHPALYDPQRQEVNAPQ